MSEIGHNNGPTLEAGAAFRTFAWRKARADLLPTLPIEIVRGRVARARALGLPYKTYASVRASTGRDVVGFLFSNNALRVLRPNAPMPQDRVAALAVSDAVKTGLSHLPIRLDHLGLDACAIAPGFHRPWSEIRHQVQAPLRALQLPLDGMLVIGDTTQEREWSEAGKLAGFLMSDQFFTSGPGK